MQVCLRVPHFVTQRASTPSHSHTPPEKVQSRKSVGWNEQVGIEEILMCGMEYRCGMGVLSNWCILSFSPFYLSPFLFPYFLQPHSSPSKTMIPFVSQSFHIPALSHPSPFISQPFYVPALSTHSLSSTQNCCPSTAQLLPNLCQVLKDQYKAFPRDWGSRSGPLLPQGGEQ